MQKKIDLNVGVSAIIVLALVGFLVFISLNKPTDMDLINNGAIGVGVAKVGDEVSMNYTGRLEDGTVFDSNVDPRFQHVEPFIFTLGAGQVIPGWDKGIVGMKVGEKKILTVAPEDAYRESGIPGIIPPNATLIFDVELVSIIK